MKPILAAIALIAAGCASAPEAPLYGLKAGDTTYTVLPEPVEAGHNIYLIKRNEARPYLEWVDGEVIAEDFCQKRKEGKGEVMIGTYPDLMAFECELGAKQKPPGGMLVIRPSRPAAERE